MKPLCNTIGFEVEIKSYKFQIIPETGTDDTVINSEMSYWDKFLFSTFKYDQNFSISITFDDNKIELVTTPIKVYDYRNALIRLASLMNRIDWFMSKKAKLSFFNMADLVLFINNENHNLLDINKVSFYKYTNIILQITEKIDNHEFEPQISVGLNNQQILPFMKHYNSLCQTTAETNLNNAYENSKIAKTIKATAEALNKYVGDNIDDFISSYCFNILSTCQSLSYTIEHKDKFLCLPRNAFMLDSETQQRIQSVCVEINQKSYTLKDIYQFPYEFSTNPNEISGSHISSIPLAKNMNTFIRSDYFNRIRNTYKQYNVISPCSETFSMDNQQVITETEKKSAYLSYTGLDLIYAGLGVWNKPQNDNYVFELRTCDDGPLKNCYKIDNIADKESYNNFIKPMEQFIKTGLYRL